MLRKYKADIIMLQETKKPVIDRKCFQTLSGSRNRDWIFTLADGSAGAMLIGWKKNQFELLFTEHGLFSLSVKLLDRSSGLTGWFSYIYGPSSNRGKNEIWTELFDLGNLTEGAWCVGGKFNEIFCCEDRNGRRNSNVEIKKFHKWVADFTLIDISIKNQQYTCSNLRGKPLVAK